MAALNSTQYASQPNIPAGPLAKGALVAQTAVIAVPSSGAGTALNDTLGFFTAPRGATLRSLNLIADQLDSGGNSASLTIDVGYAGAAQAFIAAWAGASGAVTPKTTTPNVMALDPSLIGFQFTADTPLFATIHAAANTKAAGNLALRAEYTMDGLPS